MLYCYILQIALALEQIQISFGKPEDLFTQLNETRNEEADLRENRRRILNNHPIINLFDNGKHQEQIVFPDDKSIEDRIGIKNADLKIMGTPKCARNNSYCEYFENYPHVQVNEVLQNNPAMRYLFGKDEMPPEISNRVSDDNNIDEKFVCRAIKRIIFPSLGLNKNNKWKFIINPNEANNKALNQDKDLLQGVQIEECVNAGGTCEIPGRPQLPESYQVYCTQKFIYRRLFTINNNKEIEADSFKLPSACGCAYKQNVEFLTRMGKKLYDNTKMNDSIQHN